MEVHNWNGQDTSTAFISTKFPIYNLEGNCIGLLWNAKPVNFINPFIKTILKKSVIQLNCETPFSIKEQDVIFLLMNGFTRKEIANLLNLALRTVEGRIYSFMAKRSLSNLSQLRDFYIENAEIFRIPAILLKKGIFFMSKDFATTAVPVANRQGVLGLALVHAGMLTAMDQFMLGAVLGDGMNISEAFIAISIASLIFAMMTFGIGYIGMKEGLSGMLIAKHYGFGQYGTALIGLLISISLVGWFGVQNALFAKGINQFFKNNINGNYLAFITGLTITGLVSFGFGSLKVIAKIAVPFFIIVIVFISFRLFKSNFTDFSHMVSSGNEKINISEAITMIIGGGILATMMTPDITRFAKNKKHVFYIVLMTIFVGEFIINGVAILLANMLHSADVVNIMSMSTGTMGLVAIILATVRVNDLNLYSSALGITNTFSVFSQKINFRLAIILSGIAGTSLSASGILDEFIVFLNILGYVFPPIISIILVDYYFFIKRIKRVSNYFAILVCALGCFIGTINYAIPVINSISFTSFLYYISNRFFINYLHKPKSI